MVVESRRALREALTLYAVTLLVTVGLTLLQDVIGWLRGYLLVLVAGTFLYLPLEVLHRRGEDPADLGIHRRRLGRDLRVWLLVVLVTFPPYLLGYHVWQTGWLHHRFRPAEARLAQWPVELQDAPIGPEMKRGEVRLWYADDLFTLAWRLPPGQPFRADLDSDADLVARGGAPHLRAAPHALHLTGGADGRVVFAAPGDRLDVAVQAGGDALPSDRLRLGTALLAADSMPYRAERGLFWLLNLLLVQILLVALPEEVFYRGYLQSRLDQVFKRERRVLGVSMDVYSVLATSALFAIGHYLVIPAPQRLAVFFPSLLFGWLRRKTGSVGTSVLYHASCNILVELASLAYGL